MPIRLDTPRTLNLSFASEREKVSFLRSLHEGQTVQARVLDRGQDGRWALRIRGQDLLAESRLPLVKGQTVSARVEGLGPPVVLSIVEGEADGEAALSRALKDLGLEDDPAGRAALGRMIARQLPLDGPSVERLRDAMLRMGLDLSDAENVNRTVDAMLLLASRSVPVTPDALTMALAASAPAALGGVLGNLLDLIRNLSRGLRSPVDAELRALEETLSALLVSAEGVSGEDLRRLFRDAGLGLEGKLKALTERPEDPDLQRLSQTDLKAALLRLLSALNARNRGGAADEALLEALRGSAGEALRHIEGLQILNLPAQNDPAPHLFLQIPLLFGGERTSADLRVFCPEGEGRRRIDPENARIVLTLDLAHLGRVEVDMRVVSRIVDCRIDVDGEAQRSLFSAAQGDLKAGLEGCGYTVRTVACEVRPPAPEEGAPEEGRRKIGLDVRA